MAEEKGGEGEGSLHATAQLRQKRLKSSSQRKKRRGKKISEDFFPNNIPHFLFFSSFSLIPLGGGGSCVLGLMLACPRVKRG